MLKHLVILLCCVCFPLTLMGQAGIYSEGDIELQDLYIKAQLEKHKRNYEAQIDLLKEVVRRENSQHPAYYELGRTYLQLENWEQAQKNALKAHQLDISNEWYLILLIDISEASLDYPNAIKYCQKLSVSDASNTDYIERWAFNQLKDGQQQAALANLQRIESITGITEELSKKIFSVHDSSGNIQAAAQTLEKLSNSSPNNVRLLNNWAGYLYEHDMKSKALEVYRKVLQLEPNNTTALLVVNQNDQDSGINAGLTTIEQLVDQNDFEVDKIVKELIPFVANMQRQGDDTNALNSISEKLVSQHPSNAKTLSLRADVLFYSGKLTSAESFYQKAVSADDTRFTIWDQWMLSLWEIENYDKMSQVATDAIDLFPVEVNAYLYYSIAQFLLDNRQEAHSYIEEARWIAGQNKVHLDAIVVIERWMNTEPEEFNEFEAAVDQLDEGSLSNPMLFEMLGDIFHRYAQADKTKEYWRKALHFGANTSRLEQKVGNLN